MLDDLSRLVDRQHPVILFDLCPEIVEIFGLLVLAGDDFVPLPVDIPVPEPLDEDARQPAAERIGLVILER